MAPPAAVALLVLAVGFPPVRGPEVISPLGARFFARPDTKGAVVEVERKLDADPGNLELIMALGRAQVGVLRLHEAIATFSRGIALALDDKQFDTWYHLGLGVVISSWRIRFAVGGPIGPR